MSNAKKPVKGLSGLEQEVMEVLWARGVANSEDVREALAAKHPLKDSTVRTILRRLEEKGYARHKVEGRTYVFSGIEPRQNVAVRAVRQIIERFCEGSLEQLLVGLVENEVVDRAELEELARKIAKRKPTKGGS
jgi:predicted transcriptional regulator